MTPKINIKKIKRTHIGSMITFTKPWGMFWEFVPGCIQSTGPRGFRLLFPGQWDLADIIAKLRSLPRKSKDGDVTLDGEPIETENSVRYARKRISLTSTPLPVKAVAEPLKRVFEVPAKTMKTRPITL